MKRLFIILLLMLLCVNIFASDAIYLGIIAKIKSMTVVNHWFDGTSIFVILELTNGQEVAGELIGVAQVGKNVYLKDNLFLEVR